jgi:hypothetical protein
MRYIITAKEVAKGTSTQDIANPLAVTEIATELIITRLACIMLLKDNKITKSDTVVTNEDRKCLYENIFQNTISWKEFQQTDLLPNDDVIDLLSSSIHSRLHLRNGKNQKIPYLPFYQHWERDKKEITDINFSDLSNYDLNGDFVALLIRTRGAWPEKNLPEDYWRELIKELEKQNKKVLVFGKETEIYASDSVQYISTFRDWCGIVKHPNCKSIVSTITGGVYPAFICGNPELKLIIVDNLDLVKEYGYDPSWYNDCINFSKIQKIILNYKPTPQALMEIII